MATLEDFLRATGGGATILGSVNDVMASPTPTTTPTIDTSYTWDNFLKAYGTGWDIITTSAAALPITNVVPILSTIQQGQGLYDAAKLVTDIGGTAVNFGESVVKNWNLIVIAILCILGLWAYGKVK